MERPKVAINLIHLNGQKVLSNCLAFLNKTNYPNFEINVLFNATTDGSGRVAMSYGCGIFRSKENIGFAKGHNLLADATQSDYIAIINNDVEVEPDWLMELVDFAVKNNADICQPKVKSMRNKEMFEAAGACGGFIDKYGYEFYRGRIFDKIEKDEGQYDKPMRIFWACGSCMLIKRSLIERIGLFDESFFMYSEELDFCWRANIHGAKIYCVPSSVVYHWGSFSEKQMSYKKDYLLHRNTLIAFLKNASYTNQKRHLWSRVGLELASGIAFPRRLMPVLASFAWIIRHRHEIEVKTFNVQAKRTLDDEELNGLILDKSIAYQHFIKGKNKFSEVN
jgi:GT2 family glycosyltransferase